MRMVAFDGSELCGRAEEYYHDYLQDANSGVVPPSMVDHINRCPHCQRRLDRFREVLAEVGHGSAPGQSSSDGPLLAELQLHFACLGEPVACRRVKPFLPSLLIPSLKVRIPTPVPVHVAHCPPCSEDLESLERLGLGAEQLARLSRLYADSSAEDFGVCLRARSQASLVGPGSLERVDAEVLDHFCICPRCRSRLYRQRQKLLLDRGPRHLAEAGAIRCVEISLADVFDYVVPYGGLVGESAGSDGRHARREHLRYCPECLEKIQYLHRTVYGIAERADSGVITVCTAAESGQAPSGEIAASYGDYPIDVQVLGREPERALGGARSGLGTEVTSQRQASVVRLRPVLKTAVMAAAMIPLTILFLLSNSSASGLSPRQIDRIVAQAPNVHVSVFGENLEEPIQELWASRAQRILISETVRHHTVFELAKGRVSVAWREDGASGRFESSADGVAAGEQMMRGLLGIGPDDFPWDTELNRVEDSGQGDDRLEVYELAWRTSRYGNSSQPYRWKVYIDPVTGRPRKTEFSTWDPVDGTLVLETTRRFEYPDEGEIQRRADTLLSRE